MLLLCLIGLISCVEDVCPNQDLVSKSGPVSFYISDHFLAGIQEEDKMNVGKLEWFWCERATSFKGARSQFGLPIVNLADGSPYGVGYWVRIANYHAMASGGDWRAAAKKWFDASISDISFALKKESTTACFTSDEIKDSSLGHCQQPVEHGPVTDPVDPLPSPGSTSGGDGL